MRTSTLISPASSRISVSMASTRLMSSKVMITSAGPQQTGGQRDVAPTGIAERNPPQLGFAHPLGIEIQGQEGDLLELEKAGAGLAGASRIRR